MRTVPQDMRPAERAEAPIARAASRSQQVATAEVTLIARMIAACLVLYVFPFGLNARKFGGQLALYEIAYAFTAIVALRFAIPRLVVALRNRSIVGWSVCLYFAVLAAGVVRHRTPWSALIALEIAGAAAIASIGHNLLVAGRARPILRVAIGFVVLQFAIGVAQVLRNGAVFGTWAGETEFGFRRIDGLVGASGTLTYANVMGIAAAILCAVLLQAVARLRLGRADRWAASVAVMLATALVGLSLCRTAIIAWAVIVVVAIASNNRRRLAGLLLLMAIAMGLSIGSRADGWISRGKTSVAGTEASGSGRMALNRQAIEIFKTDPVLGVGLSKYRDVIRLHPDIDVLSTEDYVVHNAPLFALATTGAVGIAALVPLLCCVVVLAVRRGVWGIGLLLFAGPILMLAQQLFVGIGFLWLGLIVGIALSGRPGQPGLTQGQHLSGL